MLFPIGLDKDDLHRRPWVSYGIIALCVLVYLYQHHLSQNSIEDAMVEWLTYIGERPYLKIAEEDWQAIDDTGVVNVDYLRTLLDDFIAYAESGQAAEGEFMSAPVDWQERQTQQRELEARIEDFIRAANADFTIQYALHGEDMNPVTIFSHLFLHGGFWHLFGNMLFLFVTAPFIEDRWNRPLFAGFFLVGGAFAGVAYVLQYSDNFLIGASGAVSACMGAFLVYYARRRIQFFYFFFILRGTFYAAAWIVLPLYLGKELLAAFTNDAMGGLSNVAHWAHVWGFSFGLGVALLLKKTGLEKRFSAVGIDMTDPEQNPGLAAQIADEQGRCEDALTILQQAVAKEPDNMLLWSDLWAQAEAMSRTAELVRAGRKLLNFHLREQSLDDALFYWSGLVERCPQMRLPDVAGSQLAKQLLKAGRQEDACIVLDALLQHATAMPTQRVAALAELAGAVDPQRACQFADTALDRDDLGVDQKNRLKQLHRQRQVAPASQPTSSQSAPSSKAPGGAIPLATMPADPMGTNGTASAATTSTPVTQPTPAATADVQISPPSVTEPFVMMVMGVQAYPAVPESVDREGMTLLIAGKHRKQVAFRHIKAIAVAGIKPADTRPYLVMDLVIDDLTKPRDQHRVFRLAANQFQPQILVPHAQSGKQAFFALARGLAKRSGAQILPDQHALSGRQVQAFASEAAMEQALYKVI